MNLIVVGYLIYLPVAIFLIYWVGTVLFKNSMVFMMDIFRGREEIAKATNSILYSPITFRNIKYLPIKPAVKGIPANESIATVSDKATRGFFFPKPLKLSKLSLPVFCLTRINTANAMIEANV